MFFFEKKPKNVSRALRALVLAPAAGRGPRSKPRSAFKSLLVLFFRKELLPS
jgi:hypothetical protein